MQKKLVIDCAGRVSKADVELVLCFQDAKRQDSSEKMIAPKSVSGLLSRLARQGSFNASYKTQALLTFAPRLLAHHGLAVGLGPLSEVTSEKLRQSGALTWVRIQSEKAKTVVWNLDTFNGDALPAVRAFLEGMALRAYEFKKHKSGVKEQPAVKLTLVTKDKELRAAVVSTVKEVDAVGEAVTLVRNWSNEPSNVGTPEFYAKASIELAKRMGWKAKVLEKREIEREEMRLLLGVGQGSPHTPRVVILESVPQGFSAAEAKKLKTLCFVGKGVTFDSGGISIKPAANMEAMKHDMTGAATLAGAMMLAYRWNAPVRLVAVLGFVENMVDGTALSPGHIIRARSGKTVEVTNTDAEGRLVLADLLDFAQENFKPDLMIDAATLTGAASVVFGRLCTGIMGNQPEAIEQVDSAAAATDEKVWEMPLFDEYAEDLKSEWADLRNTFPSSEGGMIRGGMFLKQFVKPATPWVHVDIANTGFDQPNYPYCPKKGASGLMVRTLAWVAKRM